MRLRMFVGIVVATLFAFAAWPTAAQAAAGTTGQPASVVAGSGEAAPSSGSAATKLGADSQKVSKARVSKTRPVGSSDSSTQWIYCYDAYLGWDFYHVSCNANQWYTPWVQCSDGYWYAYASYIGHWSIWTYCPVGLYAINGVVTY